MLAPDHLLCRKLTNVSATASLARGHRWAFAGTVTAGRHRPMISLPMSRGSPKRAGVGAVWAIRPLSDDLHPAQCVLRGGVPFGLFAIDKGVLNSSHGLSDGGIPYYLHFAPTEPVEFIVRSLPLWRCSVEIHKPSRDLRGLKIGFKLLS